MHPTSAHARSLARAALLSFVLLPGPGHAADIARTELATVPLQIAAVDKPTMTLALSVEFPTAGALHTLDDYIDPNYTNAKEYTGYHDADACYAYNDTPTEAVPAGMVRSDLKRFDRIGPAQDRMCSDAFSGNFLNWASSSAIDMLRMALSGGDRYIDTKDLTVLQRAVLPNGMPTCMWNSYNFPAKRLKRVGHATQLYWGAVPAKMQAAAAGKDIWIANTLDRMYFGSAGAGTCAAPAGTLSGADAGTNRLNSDNFFYARVQVCDVDAKGVLQDVRDYDGLTLCRQYPNGNYKPVGAIQRHGDHMRLAAFGYLMDWTESYETSRYGGVLRAPMKYVGFRTFDEHGTETTPASGNPHMEWDAQTGIFHTNPDGDTTQTPRISGVINYLNKFGRTGTTPGLYKVFDPVGELHYQALRYLQGLAPTAEAVSNMTQFMRAGFPVFTEWTDPFGGKRTRTSDYACLRNNLIVIGDINSHDGNRMPAPSVANNIPDIAHWRSVVQAFERGQAMNYVDGQGAVRSTVNPNTPNPAPPRMTHRSQIMGSAYWARTHDIRGADWTAAPDKQRPGLRVKTILFDVNELGAGTAADSTRRTGNQFFMAAKYGGFETQQLAPGHQSYGTRGNPFLRDDGTADDDIWQKPEDPGEAKSYYLQKDGRAVLHAFEDIFRRVGQSSRSIGGSGTSSRRLGDARSSLVYQGAFNAEDWTGDVIATRVSLVNGEVSVGAAPQWSAAARMRALRTPATSRQIIVGRDGSNPVPVAASFLWNQVSATQQAALDKATPASTARDGLGEKRLSYLRGDRSQEATDSGVGLFRPRTGLIGDIVNAGVVYAGKPAAQLNAAGYGTFASADRRAAVYAGANDGMLHAFDASDGTELFAYIPSWLVPQLPALTAKDYAANHRSYVDAPPTVGPADIGSSSTPAWRMVLVGGTGGGGKGVYALDVSAPERFDASKVLWEFTQAHDADMGQVVGQPRILRMRTSAPGATPRYRWFAAVASGVNNYVGSGDGAPAHGRPALFLLDLAKAAGTPWVLGTNYFKMSVPIDAALAATVPPGLVSFSADLGVAGEVVRIYMGDLHGQLWRLDFDRAGGTTDWTMDKLSAYRSNYSADCGGCALPLYIARDADGNVQPITMAPTVAYGSERARYVVFGTGRYLAGTDRARTGRQTYYALHDDIATPQQPPDTAGAARSIVAGRARLMAGSVEQGARTVSVGPFRWGRRTTAMANARSDVYSGWYFDFPDDGERLVSDITMNGDLLEFNTLYPPATGICAGNGSSNAYALKLREGGGDYRPSTVGELGESMVMTVSVEEVGRHGPNDVSASDSLGRRIRRTVTRTIDAGALGVAGAGKTTTQDLVVGRMSWRRIDNYQDLKR